MKFSKILDIVQENKFFQEWIPDAPFLRYSKLKCKIKKIQKSETLEKKLLLSESFKKIFLLEIEKWIQYTTNKTKIHILTDKTNEIKMHKIIKEYIKINREATLKILEEFEKRCSLTISDSQQLKNTVSKQLNEVE